MTALLKKLDVFTFDRITVRELIVNCPEITISLENRMRLCPEMLPLAKKTVKNFILQRKEGEYIFIQDGMLSLAICVPLQEKMKSL